MLILMKGMCLHDYIEELIIYHFGTLKWGIVKPDNDTYFCLLEDIDMIFFFT